MKSYKHSEAEQNGSRQARSLALVLSLRKEVEERQKNTGIRSKNRLPIQIDLLKRNDRRKVKKRKFIASFNGMRSACSYERSEVKFRYNTKTTQENLYQKLLQSMDCLKSSNMKFVVKNILKIN